MGLASAPSGTPGMISPAYTASAWLFIIISGGQSPNVCKNHESAAVSLGLVDLIRHLRYDRHPDTLCSKSGLHPTLNLYH
jgi:hypothetical protein